jgi:hypothetical protein
MSPTDFGTFLTVVIPLVVALLSSVIMDGLKGLIAKVDELPTLYKKIISATLSFAIGYLATRLGILPELIPSGPLSIELLNGLLNIFITAGVYKIQKRRSGT